MLTKQLVGFRKGVTMKLKLIATMALTLFSVTSLHATQTPPSSGSDLGSVSGGVFKDAHLVIDNKCLKCHSAKRIEAALSAGRDMQEVQRRMELKGVKLSADEQKVLGIFWKESPLKQKK